MSFRPPILSLSLPLLLSACGVLGAPPDVDQDGYIQGDCQPGDPDIHPAAVERENGQDDDCDGLVDEGTLAFDDDGDGFDEHQGDCDDGDPEIHPDAVEGPVEGDSLAPNGLDDDCDGVVDEGTTGFDDDGDGYAESEGDCDDTVVARNPGEADVCNGIDDDCDGVVDDLSDDDGDGFLSADDCTSGWSGDPSELDADDGNADVYPGAPERCDGLDNDQDGLVDEDFDADGDLFPSCGGPERRDCDDSDPNVHPRAQEICNDGIDDDCDGMADGWDVDDADAGVMDDDGDGWYCENDPLDCEGDGARNRGVAESWNGLDDDCDGSTDEGFDLDGDGYASDDAPGDGPKGDCNDADAETNPSAKESCDGQDNDCDGRVDENLTTTYFRDADSDGFGDADDSRDRCTQPTGFVESDDDCDDSDGAVYPGAQEVCNLIDDNCSGAVDEGVTRDFYRDADGDGFGDDGDVEEGCTAPTGYANTSGDCDDDAADVNPAEPEVCFDGIDQDCDASADGGCGMYLGTEVVQLSPGAGTNDVVIELPENYDDYVVFLAPESVIEHGGKQCDYRLSYGAPSWGGDGWAELTATVELEACGNGWYANPFGFEAQLVVVATVDTGDGGVVSVDLDSRYTNAGSDVLDPGDSTDTLAFCSLDTADGEGDVDMAPYCTAAISSSLRVSGTVGQDYGNNGFAQAQAIGIGFGSNLSGTLESFDCDSGGSDTITHTVDTSLGDDHAALILPNRVWTGSEDHLSYESSCALSGSTWTCTIDCYGSGYGVDGEILFVDGEFGAK